MEAILQGMSAWVISGFIFYTGWVTALSLNKEKMQTMQAELEHLKYRLEMSENCKAALTNNVAQLQAILVDDLSSKTTPGIVEKILHDCGKKDVPIVQLHNMFNNMN